MRAEKRTDYIVCQIGEVHSLSPDAFTKLLNQFVELEAYGDVLEYVMAYAQVHSINTDKSVYLFEKLIFALDALKHLKKKKNYEGLLINQMGIICYYNQRHSDSIGYYLMGLLKVKESRARYYHNIADCLASMKSYEAAYKFYNRALNELKIKYSEKDEKYIYIRTRFMLNMVACMTYMDRVEEAKRKIIELEKCLVNEDNSTYLDLMRVRIKITEIEDREELWEYIQTVNQGWDGAKIDRYRLFLNEALLESGFDYSGHRETLLLENLKICQSIKNDKLQTSVLLDLIDWYEQTKEKDKKIKYLERLFELSKKETNELDTLISSTFIQLYTDFFRELMEKNKTIGLQKSELEELTYILSHDLKTPLRGINSFVSLIKNEIKEKKYDSIDLYADYIVHSTKTLYKLVEDVNELFRFKKIDGSIEEIDLNKVVDEVRLTLINAGMYQNIKLIVENPLPKIRGHKSNFTLLFGNLIENGLKYNKSKMRQVVISSKEEVNKINIYFKDNGIGVEEEYLSYIFKYFKRLHHQDTYSGTGLGLGICKKIVEYYGGNIIVDSVPNEGSTFIVTLPKI